MSGSTASDFKKDPVFLLTVHEGENVYVGNDVRIAVLLDRRRDTAQVSIFHRGNQQHPMVRLGQRMILPNAGLEIRYGRGGGRMVKLVFFVPKSVRIDRESVRRKQRRGAA